MYGDLRVITNNNEHLNIKDSIDYVKTKMCPFTRNLCVANACLCWNSVYQEAENLDDGMSHLCEVHGYVFPCPVCDGDSDS